MTNVREAVEACLSVDVKEIDLTGGDRVLEIAVQGSATPTYDS
jgi:hypothetical protein